MSTSNTNSKNDLNILSEIYNKQKLIEYIESNKINIKITE